MTVIPEKSIDELNLNEYDSLLLPGAIDIREAIEDNAILDFIKKFEGMPIGSNLYCPVAFIESRTIGGQAIMAGVNPGGLIQRRAIQQMISP